MNEIGKMIHQHLVSLGLETPMIEIDFDDSTRLKLIEKYFAEIMTCLGLDLNNDSLRDTPKRVAKMFGNELFYGLDYNNFPKCTAVDNSMQHDEMVVIRNIEVKSCCEHHFLPIIGNAHIAYIPNEKVLGLSKFNRIVDFFSRRPQIQERLIEQIHATLCCILDTENVAIVIEGEHFCVKMRGVQDEDSDTLTCKLSGVFKTRLEVRQEFLGHIRRDAK